MTLPQTDLIEGSWRVKNSAFFGILKVAGHLSSSSSFNSALVVSAAVSIGMTAGRSPATVLPRTAMPCHALPCYPADVIDVV